MRAAAGLSVAVRRASGEIVVREQLVHPAGERHPTLKLPLLRGIVVLFETVAAGFDALDFSAKQTEVRPPTTDAKSAPEQTPTTAPAAAAAAGNAASAPTTEAAPASTWGTTLTFVVAIGLGLGLFVALPHGLSVATGNMFGGFALSSPVFHLVAGFFKLAIFIGYLSLLSLLPDVRRVFMYHGAEHMVIATFEAQEPLDVAHARTHTTFHARCGTSFLLVVVLASIVVFAVILPLVPGLGDGLGSHLGALAIKIPLLLPIAALAYEVNRYAAEHLQSRVVRALVTPGFWMQRLTTRKPTDDMLEVSIASLKAALHRQAAGAGSAPASIVVYPDFGAVLRALA